MTTPSPFSEPSMSRITHYAALLKTFASSPSPFRLLHSIPTPYTTPPKTLYILDSSFNPPTLAHLHIARSALLSDSRAKEGERRILLLLATQNADKAPKPAGFAERLCMMEILGGELLDSIAKEEKIGLDIGVIKLPYFVDKARAITESHIYGEGEGGMEQVHLTGYDTLIRILDSKYYDKERGLMILEPFLERNRLRVTYRAGDQWGGREMQDAYVRGIGAGEREQEGVKREWITKGRIELVGGKGGEVVSSTKVREAVKKGDRETLGRLVTKGVGEWVLESGLYLN